MNAMYRAGMTNDRESSDSIQRWVGMLFLAISFAMMIWGQLVFGFEPDSPAFVFFWVVCFAFSVTAVVMGILDVRRLLREIRSDRMTSMRRTMRAIKHPDERADGCVTEK